MGGSTGDSAHKRGLLLRLGDAVFLPIIGIIVSGIALIADMRMQVVDDASRLGDTLEEIHRLEVKRDRVLELAEAARGLNTHNGKLEHYYCLEHVARIDKDIAKLRNRAAKLRLTAQLSLTPESAQK